MSTNENTEEVIDSQETDESAEETEVETDVETEEETADTREDSKSTQKRTPKEKLEYYEGAARRLRKKLGIESDSRKEEGNSNDLGERAFLAVNGIKTPDEVAFFRKMKKETGKDAESLLETTYFQSEFSSFKEKKASDLATPTKNKRSSNTSADSVEYWIAKGDLPPVSEVELRRKVVNARMKKEESKGQFYNS